MSVINISLPSALKARAQEFVSAGQYSSFSDFVREAIREKIATLYGKWQVTEIKREVKAGRGYVLKTDKDITEFMKKFKTVDEE